jgi:NAD(P)-dependent dehydrogenase (short-subunit alcohol dehydrogenase family)
MTGSAGPPEPTGVAVVTGGAKGIGMAVSLCLARSGYDVVVTGRGSAALDEACALIQSEVAGAGPVALRMDVRNSDDIDAGFAVIRELGPLRVLVNCAGVIVRKPAQSISDDEWNTVIDTDLSGVLKCCRAAYPLMIAAGSGAIVNVSSIAAFVGLSERVAYTAAKAGVEGITRTLALEWANHSIRVNSVAPGWTMTEMVAAGIASGKLDRGALISRTPMGRLAEPGEIADAVSYLVSPQAGFITGQTLVVDGGYSINGNA